MNRVDFFKENGYYIERKLFSHEDMENMFYLFYDVFLSLANKFGVPLSKDFSTTDLIKFNTNLKDLDLLMSIKKIF